MDWKRIYKMLRKDFKQFANQGTMKAFSFIANAEYRWESVVWATVVLIFIGITFWNVAVTCISFRKGDTFSKINTTRSNEIEFANPLICMSLEGQTRFGCDKLPPISKLNPLEVLKTELDRLAEVFNRYANASNHTTALRKFLNDSKSPQFVLDVADAAFDIDKLINIVEIDEDENFADMNGPSLLLSQYQAWEPYLHDSATLLTLRQYLGSLICYNLAIHTVNQKNTFENHTRLTADTLESPCEPNNIQWFGVTSSDSSRYHMCVKVTTPNWLKFEATQRKVAKLKFHTMIDFPYKFATLHFKDSRVPTLGHPNILELIPNKTNVVTILEVGKYDNLYRRGKCNEKHHVSECFAYHTVKYVEKYCECWPSSYSYLNGKDADWNLKLDNCTLNHYYNASSNGLFLTNCSRNVNELLSELSGRQITCPPECDYILYDFRMELKDEESKIPGFTTVRFTPKNYVHSEIVEVLAMDTRGFLSALGGSFSLWIGASFVGILHMITFAMRSIYSHINAQIYVNRIRNQNVKRAVVLAMVSDLTATNKPLEPDQETNNKKSGVQSMLETEEAKRLMKVFIEEYLDQHFANITGNGDIPIQ